MNDFPKSDEEDWMDKQRYRQTGRHTYKIEWTPMGSFRIQCGDKCISNLEPQTGNVFILISSVGVQCRYAFI